MRAEGATTSGLSPGRPVPLRRIFCGPGRYGFTGLTNCGVQLPPSDRKRIGWAAWFRKMKGQTMTYYIAAKLQLPFDDAIVRTEAALKTEGFGVISRIDIQKTLKSKIDVDFRPYTILGACNPSLAHEALQLEDKVGLMLPCNVIVQQSGSDEVEIAAIDPVASMQAITNPGLLKAADTVREKLVRAIARVAS